MKEKAKVTIRFLQRKVDEYEALAREIEELKQEADRQRAGSSPS